MSKKQRSRLSNPRRPRHSRRPPGPDPALRRLIDALCPDPDVRPLLYEAMRALDGDALAAYDALDTAQRGHLILTLRDAVLGLGQRRPCDFCDAPAVRIKFVLVKPTENLRAVRRTDPSQGLTAFLLLCGRCAQMGEAQTKAKMLDKVSALQESIGDLPQRREAIIAPSVGEVVHLPPHCRLESCAECESPVWLDPNLISGPASEVSVLCIGCAERAIAQHRLEFVPVFPS